MNIRININCIHSDRAWCTNKNVKRSLFGIGARCCVEYPPFTEKCEYKVMCPKPTAPPSPVPPKKKCGKCNCS
jgi:hypothetical protein